MGDILIGNSTAGGITKTYIIRDGTPGNLTDSGKFYALSEYEMAHDISNIQRNASGQVIAYRIGASQAQVQQQVQAQKAAAITYIDPQKTAGYAFKYSMSNAQKSDYLNAKARNPSLTEYAYRKSKGITVEVYKGSYATPVAGSHTVNKAPVGSGDKKLTTIKSSSSINNSATAKTNTAQKVIPKVVTTTPVKTTNKTVVKPPAKTTVVAKTNPAAIKSSVTKATTTGLVKTPTVKSGDAKIAAIKVSSSINNSASAKTGTAQKATPKVVKKVESQTSRTSTTTINPQNMSSMASVAARMDTNLYNIMSIPSTASSSKGVGAFKTVAQVKAEQKEDKLQKDLGDFKKQYGDNKITNAIATGYYYTTDAEHVQTGINVADKQTAEKLTFLPSSTSVRTSIEKSTDESNAAVDKLYSAIGKPKSAQKVVSGIKDVEKGVGDFAAESYASARDKPVTAAGKLALMYAGGRVAGAIVNAGKIGTSVGLVKAGNILEDAGLPLVGLTTKYVGKAVPLAADTALGGALVSQVGSQVASAAAIGGTSGATKAALGAGAEFVVAGAGFSKGSRDVAESKALRSLTRQYNPVRVTDISPKVTSAKISEIVGGGADTKPVDLKYGRSFAVGSTPLVTHVSGKGFSRGAGAAPESILSGKTTQSFAKIENPFFAKTVRSVGGETEAQYLTSAMSMAEKVYATRKPLYVAEKFEITSKAIPENQRDAVVRAIKTYDGEIKVAGSVPMKSQSTPFTTREPHDLELYSDSVDSTITHITKSLTSRGFKEGKDFRRAIDERTKTPTNQVEFAVKDETTGKKVWDTGIEVFDHSTTSYTPKGSKNKSEIAFGYSEKPAVLVGTKKEGFIRTQDLSEQVARKIAGSTFLKEKILQPAHPNRVKDILDATTSSTAFAVKGNVPIERDIVTFVNTATRKFTPSEKDVLLVESAKKGEYKPETDAQKRELDTAKMKINFEEKVATDPVFSFIRENQRLPTLKEAPSLNKIEISNKVLLFEKAANTARKDVTDNGLTSRRTNTADIITRRNEDVFGKTRERSTSIGGYSTGSRHIGKSIGYSPKPRPTFSERKIASQNPFISGKTESIKPIIGGKNADVYGSNAGVRKTDVSGNTFTRRDVSTSKKPTNIVSTSQHGNNPFNRNASPSPTRNTSNWGNVISPSPTSTKRSPSPTISPSPSSGTKSPSPGNKSPSPSPKSPSPSSKSPSPTTSPSPSPSPSPKPSPSPRTSPSPSPSPSPVDVVSPSPSPSPKQKKRKDTRITIHEKKEIEKEKKDSMRSWRSALLLNSDKLLSKTKVAGFRESIKSSNSTKRKATSSAFVSSKKSKLTKMIGR